MKTTTKILTAALSAALLSAGAFASASTAPLTQNEQELAKNAYIYAYSIDEAYKFFYETAVKDDYPLNQFKNIRHIADDSYTDHVTINNDTLHLMGWLDVAAEPVIVSVPDMDEGRYWILHTMDMGHYTNAMIGSRTRGTKGGQFMFVSQSWDGEVPASVDEVIRVESNLTKLMGRIMAVGPDDEKVALNYMDQWTIRTLSAYLGEKGPKPVERQYLTFEDSNWLQRVNTMLCDGTMGDADKQWIEQYKSIGIEACKTDFTDKQLELAKIGEKLGMERLTELAPQMTDARALLGTRDTLGDGDRELFAEGTFLGQWGLPPVEASYRKADFDDKGEKLDGSKGDYVMRFKAPNVSEFWSVTVYGNDDRLMAHNSINRHSRGDRTLKADKDGYYTIHMSAEGDAKDANFLPVPKKPFYLIMRYYGPDEDIQSGKTAMPEVVKVQ
ncbi:DUF1254 domain-containing protein [Vibrio diazotrophicus]|uniref:DUF1254 domain-containing protein n=1 Tax=Vibrio diazotrophicus TaxID=685 RepID=A0ABX4W4Q4_VIBDI|nr:DUF1254 domain-containing protein [Vibrio diazotrophicus]PNH96130.1 hypothetical protein C1O25_21975 [Vibrio diazotrophicus]